jgi:hypothetical protein
VSEEVLLTRGDEDEMKVKALEYAAPPGQRVFVKVGRQGHSGYLILPRSQIVAAACLQLWLVHVVALHGGMAAAAGCGAVTFFESTSLGCASIALLTCAAAAVAAAAAAAAAAAFIATDSGGVA